MADGEKAPLSPVPIKRNGGLTFSRFLERKDDADGRPLDGAELSALAEFTCRLQQLDMFRDEPPRSDDYLLRFLMARKFNVARAMTLYAKYQETFGRNARLITFDSIADGLRSRKLMLPGTRDPYGAPHPRSHSAARWPSGPADCAHVP